MLATRYGLYDWLTPDDFKCRSDDALASLTKIDTHVGKPCKEAWVLARIAILLNAISVRLEKSHHPDGWLRLDVDREVPVEVTELLQEGRKRGVEDEELDVYQEQAELNSAIENNEVWLKQALGKKRDKSKNYKTGTILIIYHNTSLYSLDAERNSLDAERTASELEQAASYRCTNISGVLILYHGHLYGTQTIAALRRN